MNDQINYNDYEYHPSPDEQSSKWQPIMLILTNGKRVDCECGSIAIFAIADSHNTNGQLSGVSYYCQSCYQQDQERPE